MAKVIGWLLCGALVGAIAVALIGRALDVEMQDRVLITYEDGSIVDCARTLGPHGAVSYGDCHRVP